MNSKMFCLSISLCIFSFCISSRAFADKEYVTLEYGDVLYVPADKLATFISAHFNIQSHGGSAFAEMSLIGGIPDEVVSLPATPLYKLMPTFAVGVSALKGTVGTPPAGAAFSVVGGAYRLVVDDQGSLSFDTAGIIGRAVVQLEDAVTTDCCGSTGSNGTLLPLSAVVIPSDAAGNVQISLESSEDAVNWVPATPGAYPSTSTNRFFRARGELLGP